MIVAVAATIATILALAMLLMAEHAQDRRGKWTWKPIASLGFIIVALGHGPSSSTYDVAIVAGLFLGAIGDVLLIPKAKQAFMAGLGVFLLGHVAYVMAFWSLGVTFTAFLPAFAVLLLVAALVAQRLLVHVPQRMKVPVALYILVITVMMAAAVTAFLAGANGIIVAGSALFYLSDLAVARERFVEPGFVNRAVGLPMYYVGQLLLAWSITWT